MIIEGGALVGIVTAGDIERALKVSGAGARCGDAVDSGSDGHRDTPRSPHARRGPAALTSRCQTMAASPRRSSRRCGRTMDRIRMSLSSVSLHLRASL
jgi:hypothetical protein